MKHNLVVNTAELDLLAEMIKIANENLGCLSLSEQMWDADEEFASEAQRMEAFDSLVTLMKKNDR